MSLRYRATGLRRLALIVVGAATGVGIDLGFAWLGNRSPDAGELLPAAVVGAVLGLWISFGERRRDRTRAPRNARDD